MRSILAPNIPLHKRFLSRHGTSLEELTNS